MPPPITACSTPEPPRPGARGERPAAGTRRRTAPGYVHSFSPAEQERLLRQGAFLEPLVHPGMTFRGCREVLEVGCGVGAQMRLALRRHPDLRVTGVDVTPVQLARAHQLLGEWLESGRARLARASGVALPFPEATFDGVYMVWVLEHVPEPLPLLREARRVLRPGGPLYCTEVFNAGLYVWPRSRAVARYWKAFNAWQRRLGGDPDVGVRLASLASAAGLHVEGLADASWLLDRRLSRPAERREAMQFWRDLLLSAAGGLLAAGRVDEPLVAAVEHDLLALAEHPDALFQYSARQLLARA